MRPLVAAGLRPLIVVCTTIIRVFQDFAEVDLLSDGRAEIMAGRGSFIESFPLFGYDLDDYDELYAEKLELLLELREQTHVSWSGRHRAALDNAGVWPRPVQERTGQEGSRAACSSARGRPETEA
jgi:alkanesulfonate monooxygenase SsuD/methylene tetrahydromethanopterin reductase-like flavin-dependent oxidoreductase (luciferase family)